MVTVAANVTERASGCAAGRCRRHGNLPLARGGRKARGRSGMAWTLVLLPPRLLPIGWRCAPFSARCRAVCLDLRAVDQDLGRRATFCGQRLEHRTPDTFSSQRTCDFRASLGINIEQKRDAAAVCVRSKCIGKQRCISFDRAVLRASSYCTWQVRCETECCYAKFSKEHAIFLERYGFADPEK